jgi:hypothetical protein
VAEAALQPRTRVFTHGDLQAAHVFVDGCGTGYGTDADLDVLRSAR